MTAALPGPPSAPHKVCSIFAFLLKEIVKPKGNFLFDRLDISQHKQNREGDRHMHFIHFPFIISVSPNITVEPKNVAKALQIEA